MSTKCGRIQDYRTWNRLCLTFKTDHRLDTVPIRDVNWQRILDLLFDIFKIPTNIFGLLVRIMSDIIFLYPDSVVQCESKKSPLRLSNFFHFFHKRLRIFNRFFTHLLYVLMYARLQIFVQLSPTLTKLCHIMRDYLVHIICAKCPKHAKTRAFRRLRKSLIALLIVVCGKSL